jgi:hypothetical protein
MECKYYTGSCNGLVISLYYDVESIQCFTCNGINIPLYEDDFEDDLSP